MAVEITGDTGFGSNECRPAQRASSDGRGEAANVCPASIDDATVGLNGSDQAGRQRSTGSVYGQPSEQCTGIESNRARVRTTNGSIGNERDFQPRTFTR